MGKGCLSLRLFALFVIVSVLTAIDVITTNQIIFIGVGDEGNGIISLLMETFGGWWWVPKALASVVFVIVVDRMWERRAAKIAFGTVVAYYVIICSRHLLILSVAEELKRLCG